MDYRLNAKIKRIVEELAREHQQELGDAGTLVDLEELTCQIGDEVGRQLCQCEIVARAEQAAGLREVDCPECGEVCPAEDPEPTLLQGLRGELTYNQPRYYCPRCRRSFFPGGRLTGPDGEEHRHAQCLAEDGLGGKQSGQLRERRGGHA